MKLVVSLTAVGLCAAAFLTFGGATEHARGAWAERFKAADTNGDGMLSREEAAALPMIARHFDEIDADHDGQITVEELRAFHEQRSAKWWARVDTDGDGKISRAEAQANAPRLAEHFDAIDADHDGYITPEELKAARAQYGR